MQSLYISIVSHFCVFRLLGVTGRLFRLRDAGNVEHEVSGAFLSLRVVILRDRALDGDLHSLAVGHRRLRLRLEQVQRLAVLSGKGNGEVSRTEYSSTYCERKGMDLSSSSQYLEILMVCDCSLAPSADMRSLLACCRTPSR